MAASKKPTPAAKRKTAAPKKAAAKTSASATQAMDIIPKSRVRPSTTSRPVIRSTAPAVADNTMTAPSAAPTLQIKRRKITINPSPDSQLSKEDLVPNLAVGTPEAASTSPASTASAAPAEPGVSVSDLIAKRKEKKIQPVTEEPAAEPAETAEATEEPQGLVAAEPDVETTEVAAESSVPEPTSAEAPGTTPELPVDDTSPDDPAAAEAARLLSDEPDVAPAKPAADTPSEPTTAPEAPAEEVLAPDEPVAAEPEPEVDAKVEEAEEPAPRPESKEEPGLEPQPESKPAAPEVDSVEAALQDDSQPAQEHSESLKEEIKNDDQKSGQSRHDLYGGQPVIVVHKERGPMSAVAWVLWFCLCLGLALLVVNFLLDAGFIETTYRIPHTNIL